jgi:hypothetical protein
MCFRLPRGRDVCGITAFCGEEKNAAFTRFARVWPIKDGDGFAREIAAGLSVTGRFGIFPRNDKGEA